VAEALCLEHDTHADGSLDYNALCDDIFQGDFEGFNTNTTTAATASDSEQRPETDSPSTTAAVPGLWLGGVRTGGSAPGGAPPLTVRGCMRRMNEKVFTHGGDMSLQLARAMRSFSSAYARANRKKMIRKHLLAFDVGNTGRVSRAQFLETVDEVAAEFFMDFDKRDRDLLADFFFPRANCRVDYEELLDIINARDVRRAQALLQRTLAEVPPCMLYLFTLAAQHVCSSFVLLCAAVSFTTERV
jgi:Ca2+-binding EF-hand superfamily protein